MCVNDFNKKYKITTKVHTSTKIQGGAAAPVALPLGTPML